METPRRTTRTSTQAPTLSQVRQNCSRNQVFSPADSGFRSSPATGRTLNDIHMETMPEVRYRRNIGHCYPRKNHYRVIQEMSNTEKDGGNGWKKFWQIWIILLTLSRGLVASAWIYFHNDRVVQKSREYVMTEPGMPYDSDEMPSYSSPRPNQRHMELELPGQTSENMGLSPGHVQLQETDTRENESTDINETTTEYPNTWCIRGRNIPQSNEYPVRRTFSGAGNDVWNEFIQYNSTLKGHTAMKQKFVTEAKLRKRNPEESCRDFGQAIEDLYCRAYPDSPEIEDENFIKTLLDKCGQSGDFRLAVKRTRYNTLHDAVINAMQEECFRVGEKGITKQFKPVQRPIFEVEDWDSDEDVTTEAEGTRRDNVDRNNVPDNYPRNNGIESRVRFYNRDRWRGRGRSPMFKNRPPEFPEPRRRP
ncbi:unnamed protein product [Mytilus edulis]|uniref:Uncharacterized protein n=1 Tax=Mytilus edulis TaxID=6550 RepID=A0A8S3VFA1_MYTED|nr:unnamed protein product [Mytilus edulis]